MSNNFPQFFKRIITQQAFRSTPSSTKRRFFILTKDAGNHEPSNNLDYSFNFLRFNHSKLVKCWKCGIEKKSIKDLFCPKCSFIQEPHDTRNFFQLFNLKESFDIDVKSLTNQYRKLQNVIHPDKFSNKSSEEKTISQEYSSLINRAYNTLNYPLNRAVHLLHLKGERIDEDEKIVDTNFLMTIMDINEDVENADNEEKLKTLNETNKKTIAEICQRISESFKNQDIEKAKESIIKLKYYNSISQHINSILRERGIVD